MKINPNLIKDIYSTTETLTNKIWEDGKPVYRKVFKGTSTATFSTGLTSVDNVIKMDMLIRESGTSHGWRNLPWLFNTTSTSWLGGFYFNTSTGKIAFQVGSDLGAIDRFVLIMEYTKTS